MGPARVGRPRPARVEAPVVSVVPTRRHMGGTLRANSVRRIATESRMGGTGIRRAWSAPAWRCKSRLIALLTYAIVAGGGASAARAGDAPPTLPRAQPAAGGDSNGIRENGFCRYPAHERTAEQRAAGVLQLISQGETEPNNTTGTAQALPLGFDGGEDRDVDVSGGLAASDTDFYRVSLNKGDVLGLACSGTHFNFDPIVAIFDEGESFLFGNDNHAFIDDLYPSSAPWPAGNFPFESALTFVAPTTQDYFIRIEPDNLEGLGLYTLRARR